MPLTRLVFGLLFNRMTPIGKDFTLGSLLNKRFNYSNLANTLDKATIGVVNILINPLLSGLPTLARLVGQPDVERE